MKKVLGFLVVMAIVMSFFGGCSRLSPRKTPPPQKQQEQKSDVAKEQKMQSMAGETTAESKKSHRMFQTVDKKDAVLVQEGEQKEHCVRCGMNLVMFYKTNYIATTPEDGKKHQYCSLHCLVDHLNEGEELKNPKVIDVVTLKPIPVLEAYYVVGSDVPGTMSKKSKYAFSSYEAARAFVQKHGGEIMDFHGAIAEAKKDFE